MLIQRIIESQIGQWTFVCSFCGKTKPKSGPNQKCCSDCRGIRDRQYHQARYRRNIGETILCAKCAEPFALDHSTRTLCERCRRPRPALPRCVNCRGLFERSSNRQKFCAACTHVRRRREKQLWHSRKRGDAEHRRRKSASALRLQNRKYRNDPAFSVNVRIADSDHPKSWKEKGRPIMGEPCRLHRCRPDPPP